MNWKVSVVIPCYNEATNLRVLYDALIDVLAPFGWHYELIFVDDGSRDGTLTELERLHNLDPSAHFLSFSRNFGHQPALKAGLDAATGDCVISMDADMQHPPALIPQLVQKWQEGYDVVYTRRLEDKRLPLRKRLTSRFFYRVMNNLSDMEIEEGTADFRLLDRTVVNVLQQLPERDLFMRGLVKWVGFKQFCIDYEPAERFSGVSKYSFGKMFVFALNGITSFSVKPLRLAMLIGFALSLVGFGYGVFAFASFFFTDWNASGWTSVIMGVLFIGGLQLVMLGIIGEYIGKLFMQAKQRPSYIVQKTSLSHPASEAPRKIVAEAVERQQSMTRRMRSGKNNPQPVDE